MTTPGLRIRAMVEDDWAKLRDLRVEMLADTPIAFEERLSTAQSRVEHEWRARAARGSTVGSTTLVAELPDGRWVGTMGAYVPPGATLPYLVAVYVAPSHRGSDAGVADALLTAIEEWARARADTLVLEVHESNGRARAYYTRHGFTETGRTRPYPFDTIRNELEMVKRLT